MTSVSSSDAGSVAAFLAFYEWARQEPLYIILGAQGSGTNLLVRLLARVYGMSVMRDQSLVLRTAARVPTAASPQSVARAFATLGSHVAPSALARRTRRRLLHRDDQLAGIDRVFPMARVDSATDLAMFVHAYRAFPGRARLMGVKSDDIWAHADDLPRVHPNRRIILLTRDPRDNAVSVMGKGFGPVEPFLAARFVQSRLAAYEREFARAPEPKVHVRFEDLLDAPAAVLADLGRRFGWPLPDDMADTLAGFPLRSGRVGRWTSLSPRDLAWCESLLAEAVIQHGATVASPVVAGPGPLDTLLLHGRDAVGRVPAKLAFLRSLIGGRS